MRAGTQSVAPSLLEQRIATGPPVLLSGAMGTELPRRGVETVGPLWSSVALLTCPALVAAVHRDYVKSGAEILTTNTFRTNLRAVSRADIDRTPRALTLEACALARGAAGDDAGVYVGGCVAPVEDCYEPWLVPSEAALEAEHIPHLTSLLEGGVDFIFAETMNTLRETEVVLRAASSLGAPVAVSFVCAPNGTLLSGEPLVDAIRLAERFSPLFIGVNCRPASELVECLDILVTTSRRPTCVYANGLGRPSTSLGWEFGDVGSEVKGYLEYVVHWADRGVRLLGGCCGTTPEYIAAIRDAGLAGRPGGAVGGGASASR